SRPAAVAVIPHPPLRLDGVTFAYGTVPALAGLSFSIAPGERVALLGRNGAGKSTVVRLVAGLERPDDGTVWVGAWDTRDCSPGRWPSSRRCSCSTSRPSGSIGRCARGSPALCSNDPPRAWRCS